MPKAKAKVKPWHRRVGYRAFRFGCRMAIVTGFGFRCKNRNALDRLEGALICPNHQSYLDPVMVGCAFDRRVNYLARKSLFRFPVGNIIKFLEAIPLDRNGLGLSGMKETLRRLRGGEPVLVFPEGTRSRDTKLGPMLPGVCALARRGRVPLLPVGIAGAFDAWPRNRLIPQPGIVQMVVGDPISCEWYADRSDDDLLGELTTRISDCFAEAEELQRWRTRRA